MNTAFEIIIKENPAEWKNQNIITANYAELANEIPDKELLIESYFINDELIEVQKNFEEFIDTDSFIVFAETLGGNMMCLGSSSSNYGQCYHYDFDFGLISLGVTLAELKSKLIPEK